LLRDQFVVNEKFFSTLISHCELEQSLVDLLEIKGRPRLPEKWLTNKSANYQSLKETDYYNFTLTLGLVPSGG